MSFRVRLTLVAAAAVGLAVVVGSALIFVLVRNELQGDADKTLQERAAAISGGGRIETGPSGSHLDIPPFFGVYAQVVNANGQTVRPLGQGALPISKRVLDVARGHGSQFFSETSLSGRPSRVLTIPIHVPDVGLAALQVATDVSGLHRTLHRIGIVLILIALGGIAVAAGLGLAVSQAALRPVRRLTQTTETVTETGDLSQRIEASGQDELGRLAASFNTMLAALEESSRAQRQLVADASHELRTPLTSLRTNIEVLAGERSLPPGERERLLSDVVEQLGEMTTLIAELIELARAELHPEEAEDVRLDLLAAGAVERAKRNRPQVRFTTDLEESVIHGAPSTIERAVANLLDNAAKWTPAGGEVEVVVRDGELTVRDSGPGIAEEDLPYIFDRFYRASSARGLPGSGLGLAIVKQVAEAHGGQVVAERADGGGTLMRLRLNGRGAS
ncbi:MAG: HAMP domain-containing sensor histidine kinase [Gaiellaceae bacterium]